METVIYIRTSSEDQEPENQIKDCETLTTTEYTLLQDKQSAFLDNKEREKFEEARRLIKSGKVKHFIVWDLDRIYRNRIRLKEFFQFCNLYKCAVHSFNQQWLEELTNIPPPFNEIMHDLMLNLMGWLAEDESVKKSKRVKLAVRRVPGKPTRSYKGNKWGRKSISTQKKNKVLELAVVKPKLTLREISEQSGVSLGRVHKTIKEFKSKKDNENNVQKGNN